MLSSMSTGRWLAGGGTGLTIQAANTNGNGSMVLCLMIT